MGATKEIPNAPSLNEKIKREVKKTAEKIHKLLGLGHYSRIDFIVANGKPYVLEVNTIPGMTASSLLPKAAKAENISFPDLTNILVTLAITKPV